MGLSLPVILLGRLLSFYRVRLRIPASVFSSSCTLVDRLRPYNELFSLKGVSSLSATLSFARFIVLSVGLYKSLKLSMLTFSCLFYLDTVGERTVFDKCI